MIAWWAQKLKPDLSQGDVLKLLYLPVPTASALFLKKGSAKGQPAWFDSQTPLADGPGSFPTRQVTKPLAVIVVSHDCELDKVKRVVVAPVASMDAIEKSDDRNAVVARRSYSKLPLMATPELGACYADLRGITSLDRRYIDTIKRVASMTEEGLEQLQHQLIAVFTRLDWPR